MEPPDGRGMSPEQRAAYRAFVRDHHPDRGGDPDVFVAGLARFRAILLTSLTTFAGLTPLMLEKSVQAQFLVPMAISLAFGVLFATFLTLLLIPAGYLILEDLTGAARWLLGGSFRRPIEVKEQPRLRAG